MDHWRLLGAPHTLLAAIPNARAFGQPGLTKGLPDLMAMGPDGFVGFIELKRDEKSKRSQQQIDFGWLCRSNNIPYALAVGRDEPIAILEDWGIVKVAAQHKKY
jgi:hypothetical protein